MTIMKTRQKPKVCWLWKNIKCEELEIDGKRPCMQCDWHAIYVNQADIENYVSYEQAIVREKKVDV